jgi:carbon-monoxide dehydrogenase iron sulfur subunit
MAKRIVVKKDRCLACGQCMIACALAHSDAESLVEAAQADSPPESRIRINERKGKPVPVQCHHCKKTPCIDACPENAISRPGEDGPVLLDRQLCIGCKLCMEACPFDAIFLPREGKALLKCDLCIERTAAGDEPACVSACPVCALEFGDPSARAAEKAGTK